MMYVCMYVNTYLFTYMHTYIMCSNIYINTGKDNFYGRSPKEDMPSKDLVQAADYRGTLRLVISCAPLRNEMGSALPPVLCPMQCGAAFLQVLILERPIMRPTTKRDLIKRDLRYSVARHSSQQFLKEVPESIY